MVVLILIRLGKKIPKAGQSMQVMGKMAGAVGKNLTKALGPIGLIIFAVSKNL